ncbi:MAG: hypothetical protein ABW252_13080 [Polyangiales bacterium]
MSKLPRVTEQLVDEARRAHDPSAEQRARTLDALHARLDFHGELPRKRHAAAAAAAAAAVAADAVVASTSKAASAVTGKLVFKLMFATVALGGGVTTAAVMVRDQAPRVAVVEHAVTAPRAPKVAQTAPVIEPTPVVDAVVADAGTAQAEVAPARVTRRPAEMTLIGRALAHLRDREPQRTLTLLDEHAEHYPNGKFATERKGLRVLALCAAGRIEEGRRARAAFLRELARAPIAVRVREACDEDR